MADRLKETPDGWAAFHAPGDNRKTNGGADADPAHTYTVHNRKELVRALYPDAVFAPDGSYTTSAGPDATPKIILIQGTIDLDTDDSGKPHTPADFACPGFDFDAYAAAYSPNTWNKQTLVNGKPPALPGCPTDQEALRRCSWDKREKVARIPVGSNTTIYGIGSDAKVMNGSLVVGWFPANPRAACNTASGQGQGGSAGSAGVAGAAGGTAGGAGGKGGTAPLGGRTGSAGSGAGGRGGSAGAGTGATSATGTAGTTGGGAVVAGTGGMGGAASGGAGGMMATTKPAMPTVDNVIVRNITFEDAFDAFPAWTPTDSYVAPPAVADPNGLYPKCQSVYDAATDNGPHQCPGGRWNSEFDNLSVANATHVWVDHCTFGDGARQDHTFPSIWKAPYVGHDYLVEHHDGLVDVTLTSDFVTISYNDFSNHDKTNLIGGSDTVTTDLGWGALSVTLHHNAWRSCGQRLPRVRFGKVHTYNNYITGQLLPKVASAADLARPYADNPMTYAMGIGYLAKLYSENNVLEVTAATGDPAPGESASFFLWHKASPTMGTTPDVNEKTYFFDAGTTFNGQATNLLSSAQAAAAALTPPKPPLTSTDTVWKPASSYSYQLTAAGAVKAEVTAKAGSGHL